MLLKIIAFIAAAIPVFLFVRRMFFRRPSRFSQAFQEAKAQFDIGIWIFLGLVGVVVAFGLGKLAWAWWTAL